MQNFYIYTFYFLFFYFFIFFGLGPAQPTWARLGPASPARPLAQASGPAGLSNTRAAALCKWIKIHLHSVKYTWSNADDVSYLVCWRRWRWWGCSSWVIGRYLAKDPFQTSLLFFWPCFFGCYWLGVVKLETSGWTDQRPQLLCYYLLAL